MCLSRRFRSTAPTTRSVCSDLLPSSAQSASHRPDQPLHRDAAVSENRLLRGVFYALLLETVAVAVMWGAFELADHSWGRFAAVVVAFCALPFLLVGSQEPRR